MPWSVKLLQERTFSHAFHTRLGCPWVHRSSYMMNAGALKIGCAELLNSHSAWCNGIKSRWASLSWAQSGTLAQNHWSTELPCVPGRPAGFAAIWALTCSTPLGRSLFNSIASPVMPLKNLGPLFWYLFSGPKGLKFFWFLSQPKEMHFRKHGPLPFTPPV